MKSNFTPSIIENKMVLGNEIISLTNKNMKFTTSQYNKNIAPIMRKSVEKKAENITKEKFNDYESVRVSGVTNMFDVKTVCDLSGLVREDVFEIMKNFTELKEKYGAGSGKTKT